jgi:hypothetical protein
MIDTMTCVASEMSMQLLRIATPGSLRLDEYSRRPPIAFFRSDAIDEEAEAAGIGKRGTRGFWGYAWSNCI